MSSVKYRLIGIIGRLRVLMLNLVAWEKTNLKVKSIDSTNSQRIIYEIHVSCIVKGVNLLIFSEKNMLSQIIPGKLFIRISVRHR